MSHLFEPLQQRSVHFRNRLVVSPMCQYSARDGMPDDWHLVHLGSRAAGGAGAVIAEATAIAPEGRISPEDTGIWNDAQGDAWTRIAGFIEQQGAVAGIQLAHAGRKPSTYAPWRERGAVAPSDGGWTPVAPTALAFDAHYAQPQALDRSGIARIIEGFALAARRSLAAGFRLVEVHAAHGYLLHQFLSPLSNRREDDYGGSFENRIRLLLEVLDAVRNEWPADLPLWVRISATDWAEGGWDIEQSIALSRLLAAHAVDLVDVSSGGLVPDVTIPVEPGYQVPFAARIRREAAARLVTARRGLRPLRTRRSCAAARSAAAATRPPAWPAACPAR